MSLLVVGSVAIDHVETPEGGRHNDLLGGSATHFSVAASCFSPVQLVGVVGEDWPAEHTEFLQGRGVDTSGLQVVEGGKTFTWTGRYLDNMNDRETLDVQLNVFGEFNPQLPETYSDAKYVFLANGVPAVQQAVLDQAQGRRIAVADTMDLWIDTAREDLDALLKQLDGLVLNDQEAKQLTGTENLVVAGQRVREMGPKFVVLKKGEHGAMFFGESESGQPETFVLPAFPTKEVLDPTGAGDSFAGGMMGYLAEQGADFSPTTIKKAIAYGTVVASFNVEGFGVNRIKEVSREDIDARFAKYRDMLSF